MVNVIDCTEYCLRLKDLKEDKEDEERYTLEGVLLPECVGLLVVYEYSYSKLSEMVHEYLQQTA